MNELKIGTRIAKLRSMKNITQLELAEKLGVTDRAVSKWETGGSYPDICLLTKIAEIFNVSLDYLLCGKSVTKQRFFVGYVGNKNNDIINDNYLSKGWKVVDMKISGDGTGVGICAVLMEKEEFED